MSENSSHPDYRITDLQVSECPREQLAALGAQALTNADFSGD